MTHNFEPLKSIEYLYNYNYLHRGQRGANTEIKARTKSMKMSAQDNQGNIPLQKNSPKSPGRTKSIASLLKLRKSKGDTSSASKQDNDSLSKTVTIADLLHKNKNRNSRSIDNKTNDKTCDCQRKSNGLEMETVCDFLGINIELDKIKRRASINEDPNYLLITILRISLEKVKALNESNTEFCHCLISAKKMKALYFCSFY